MKKIVYIITAVLALTYCTKEVAEVKDQMTENTSETTVVEESEEFTTVTFKATLETSGAGANSAMARGSVETTGEFTWSGTDEIAVWTSSQKRIATATNISGSSAEFTFTLGAGETIATGAIVVYPASLLTAENIVTFPASYSAENAAKSNLALAAEVGGNTLQFKYLGGVIEATITDIPSIATAIEVTSNEVLTGAHTVSFSAGDPVIVPSSAAKKVTVTPVGGSNTIVLPLPTAANGQTITYTVKYSDNVLFTKTATKNVARGDYFKMRNLTINPTVRMVGSLTSWDTPANYENAVLTGSGTSRSIVMTSNGDETFYYYLVEYPGNGTPVSYEMRPSADQSITALSANETMSKNDSSNSSKVNAYGRYTFTFDYTTGVNRVTTASSSDIAIYLVGSFQSPTQWSLNNDTPLTMVNSWEGYKVMDVAANSTFKAYTNPFWGSAFPGSDVKLETANYYLMVANAQATTLKGVYANATSSSASSMTLKGNFDSWGSGLAMTRIDSSPFWYVDVDWHDTGRQFKFVKNGSTWMAYGDGSYATSSASQGWTDGNISVAAGKYRIIASENDGRFAILDKN